MKIKVVEIISDMNIGGAGRLLLTRLSSCDRRKFEEIVVLPKGSELSAEFESIGYLPHSAKYCADKSFDLRAVFVLYNYFRRVRPDIINAHGCLSARVAAYLARVPVKIFTRHCAFEPKAAMTRFPIRNINGLANKMLTTRIIAVADAAADNLTSVGINRGQIDVVINGVLPVEKYTPEKRQSLRKRLGIDEGTFVCGICARLEDCKGIDCLLRAARILLERDENYFFLIVGKGSAEEKLKELSDSLGISQRVKFCGFACDVTPYLNCFDLNLNCSRGTETSSLAISEGMSIGLPCVASSWGGNPYMVWDGYNGFIYPVDDASALADRIEKLKGDRELYLSMSKNALVRYNEELNAAQMTKKTEQIYSDLFECYSNRKKK